MGFSEVNFRDYPVPNPSLSMYIGPTGNDTTGNGTKENPYLTINKAYEGLSAARGAGSTAMVYIIFKDGVYDISRGSRTPYVYSATSNGYPESGDLFLMGDLGNKRYLTLMAENPLKAFIDMTVQLGITGEGTFGAGQEYESTVLAPPDYLYFAPGTQPSRGLTFHYFYGSCAGVAPPECPMHTLPRGELPKFVDRERICFPAIYGYDPTIMVEPDNWESSLSNWSYYRYDANKYGLGMTYYFFPDSAGITRCFVAQRDDLPVGATWRTVFWDKILNINQQFPNIQWERTGYATHGGNNNNFITRIKGICFALKGFELEDTPPWGPDFNYWDGNTFTRDSNNNPDDAIALFGNKYFIKYNNQYAYEASTGRFYVKRTPGQALPRVVSNNRHSKLGFGLGGLNGAVSNITICGFVCQMGRLVGEIGSGSSHRKPMENIRINYNLMHDSGWTTSLIGVFSGISGSFDVIGNCLIRSAYRSINVSRTTFSNNYYTIGLEQLKPTLVHRNLITGWREKAGMYQSGIRVIWSNNTSALFKAAHGDGMALYQGCREPIVRGNYFFTPSILPIRISSDATTREPWENDWIIEDNFLTGPLRMWNVEDSTPWIVKNNVCSLSYESPVKIYEEKWWDAYNKKFVRNALLGSGTPMQYEGTTEIPGVSYIVYTTGMPEIFFEESQRYAGPSGGSWYDWNLYGWTLSSQDGTPVFYRNVFPIRPYFDRLNSSLSSPIIFPYASTETKVVAGLNYAYPAQMSTSVMTGVFQPPSGPNSQIEALINAYDAMFVDWTRGDFRLKPPYNLDAQGNRVGIGITRPSYNFFDRSTIDPANGITWGTMGPGPLGDMDQRVHEWWLPFDDYGNENPPEYDADLNNDGTVNSQDISLLLGNFGVSGTGVTGDINGDGVVNQQDLALLLDRWSVDNNFRLEETSFQIPNHPITIDLAPTNIGENTSWSLASTDSSSGTQTLHGEDGIYASSDVEQIPTIMQVIKTVTDPDLNDSTIGPTTGGELEGDNEPYEGGARIVGAGVDYVLANTNVSQRNVLNVLPQTRAFVTKAIPNGGETMNLIIHGKTDASPQWGEFNKVVGEPDPSGGFNTNFYKTSSWIAFGSKESNTDSVTSDKISLRKSERHTFLKLDGYKVDDMWVTNTIGNTGSFRIVNLSNTPTFNLTPILTAIAGSCAGSRMTINEKFVFTPNGPGSVYTSITQFLEVGKSNQYNIYETTNNIPPAPGTLVCGGTDLVAVTFTSWNSSTNTLSFSNIFNKSLFYGFNTASPPVRIEWDKSLYPPDGRIKVYNISTYGNTGAYQYLNVPNNSFDVRIENPINFGSKNLVEYYVPWTNGQLTPGSPFVRVGGKRLFSAPDVYTPVPVGALNMGITAGDYIEISGSSYNDGVYQVLSKRDGITNILGSNITYQPLGDLEFNVRLSYSDASDQPIIQYLELSRDIVPEPSAPGKNITIRKVTGKPVLHIKYRVKN